MFSRILSKSEVSIPKVYSKVFCQKDTGLFSYYIKPSNKMISFYNRIENIVGKGENHGYQRVLLFPLSFKKATIPARKNQGLFGKRLMNVEKVTYWFNADSAS